jgi:isoleucyl-tRNA synthetase
MERRVLDFWDRNDIYRRSLKQREGCDEWVFYEGPPTANGRPGLHHVVSRTFKDLFCRYQTMKGRYVYRKAGWDCHGLPVEIEVEKELGVTQKHEIEDRIGIDEFVRRCRESVQRYVDDWDRFTSRLGFWVDLEDAYWTMDPSVYVRFPLQDDESTALLVWTTTPWTLLANLAAAVGEDIEYVKVPDPLAPGKYLLLAADRVKSLLGEGTESVERMRGADLVGARYRPPFGFVAGEGLSHTVRPGDFVSTEDGTGIVHLAPYGEEDMSVAKRDGLPVKQMIDASGRVVPEGGPFAGLWIKDADPKIMADLESRGLLFRSELYEHSYPHCWRCSTPLLYYPRRDWYIRTSRIRERLQASNEQVNWQPETIKYGRFGDWLANNVDWSLSRDRYWGTPLPIWRCRNGHDTCIGSFAELERLSGRDLTGFDPHRPRVDEIVFPCPRCEAEARRVPSVIDVWFDSGSMPFAQWHYPFQNEDVFRRRFPAQFISEAVDQTRGWFYSLLAVSTMIESRSPYENVVCLGLLVDAEGRKMSKSLGNVIEPRTIFDAEGADALRWFMIASGSPWSARRTSESAIQEVLRKHLLTLWNTYSFWVTYAALEEFIPDPDGGAPPSERPQMDRWILAELDDTVRVVTAAFDRFDATAACRRIERFVDDLSNWYVRRSRRRFWRSGQDADTRNAFQTLWECLVTVSQLSAPAVPFVSDEIFTNLTGPLDFAPDSVHLSDWPEPREDRRDDELRARMALVRRLVSLGRAARTEAKVRVRQPLRRALVVMPLGERELLDGLDLLVAEELNVKEIEVVSGMQELVDYQVKPNFKSLGRRLGPRVKDVAKALAEAEAAAVVAAVDGPSKSFELEVWGEAVRLTREDLDIRIEGRSGFSLAREGPYGVALDLDLSTELVREGIAREVVRVVQDLRKSAGLAVEDRIHLWLLPRDESAAGAVRAHSEAIAAEVLAVTTRVDGEIPREAARDVVELDEGSVEVGLERVE